VVIVIASFTILLHGVTKNTKGTKMILDSGIFVFSVLFVPVMKSPTSYP